MTSKRRLFTLIAVILATIGLSLGIAAHAATAHASVPDTHYFGAASLTHYFG